MKKIPYEQFSSFILRSPLFPFNFLDPFIKEPHTPEEKLKEICRLPMVQEAIFLASPDLFTPMNQWLNGEYNDPKKARKLVYSLMRYVLRMSVRSTPFGLFAGFSIGKWADQTNVELPPREKYERHTRLDMNYLCALALDLAKHPVIKEHILYYPNSSIYPVGDQLRYVEYRYINSKRTHHIVAVDRSDYLEQVLQLAAAGATLKTLAQSLVEDEITFEEASDFIDELVTSQVLVHQLEPAITGPEFLDQIKDVLEPIPGIDELKAVIRDIKAALQKIDDSEIGTTTPNYHQIAESLKPLQTGYELKFLFQTDMVKPTVSCTLNNQVADDILEGFNFVNKLNSKPGAGTLSQFRDAFSERYETMEVPLLQVLDTESGIGYRQTGHAGDIAPLVDDLALPGAPNQNAGNDIKWTRNQSFLFGKLKEALIDQSMEVEFTDDDLKDVDADWSDLPDTFSSMVRIAEGENVDGKKRIIVSGFGGSSAGNLLGRFCHGDKATDTFVKEMTEVEKDLRPHQLLAEIIHLPESRVGNVLLRPVLRQYEIPYLAKSAVPPEDQIKLDDLMVSVKNNRIVLRSKKFNKEVVPRLTNAHNYSYNALPVYHFLADLQTQDLRSGLGFSWGSLANEFEVLPRAVYKNLILAPAQWNVRKSHVEHLFKIKDDEELLKGVKKWREEKKIPPHVLLADSDNKLFISLENSLCVRTLFSVTKKRPSFQLEEFVFDTDNAVVRSKDDVFTNEFVLSFHKVKAEAPAPGSDNEGNEGNENNENNETNEKDA